MVCGQSFVGTYTHVHTDCTVCTCTHLLHYFLAPTWCWHKWSMKAKPPCLATHNMTEMYLWKSYKQVTHSRVFKRIKSPIWPLMGTLSSLKALCRLRGERRFDQWSNHFITTLREKRKETGWGQSIWISQETRDRKEQSAHCGEVYEYTVVMELVSGSDMKVVPLNRVKQQVICVTF